MFLRACHRFPNGRLHYTVLSRFRSYFKASEKSNSQDFSVTLNNFILFPMFFQYSLFSMLISRSVVRLYLQANNIPISLLSCNTYFSIKSIILDQVSSPISLDAYRGLLRGGLVVGDDEFAIGFDPYVVHPAGDHEIGGRMKESGPAAERIPPFVQFFMLERDRVDFVGGH